MATGIATPQPPRYKPAPLRNENDGVGKAGVRLMSTALWLVCAAALAQPSPEPPSVIPGYDPNQPLHLLYLQPPPEQAGKKNPPPDSPPPEENTPETTEGGGEPKQPTWYSIHAQSTLVYDANFPFHDPYNGPNSAVGRVMNQQTATGTLFFDFRPWHGGEIIFNPRIMPAAPASMAPSASPASLTGKQRAPAKWNRRRTSPGSFIAIPSSLRGKVKRLKTTPTRSPVYDRAIA